MIRILDIAIATIAIVLLFPVVLPVALILRLTAEGEVFYVQSRVGKDKKEFGLIKFATMLKDSPNIGAGDLTIKDDPRVLPVGRFLRFCKINELPQLTNIILGHMSLVGPRPLTIESFSEYSPATQSEVATIRPGLSGVGSIVFRNEEMILAGEVDPRRFYKDVITPYKGALEFWYVKNRSLRIYVTLVLLTIWVIVVPRSKVIWRLFPSLPVPDDARLKSKLML